MTSALLRTLVPAVMLAEPGVCLGLALRPGSPACPFAGFTRLTASPLHSLTTRSGAGFSDLLSIAYDYNVLGLGPDSPWVDCRCPGTLRLPVSVVRTRIALLIPAFALVCPPPVLAVGLPCAHNAPLPSSRLPGGSTASVRYLSLVTLSVHAHSTSELLRTLSMMAASKPTSWLSWRTHCLSH